MPDRILDQREVESILGRHNVYADQVLAVMSMALANDVMTAMRFDNRGKWIYDSTRQEYRLWPDKPYPQNHQGVIDYLVRLAQERRAS